MSTIKAVALQTEEEKAMDEVKPVVVSPEEEEIFVDPTPSTPSTPSTASTTSTPVAPSTPSSTLSSSDQATIEALQSALDKPIDPEVVKAKAVSTIQYLLSYLKSNRYQEKLTELSAEYNIPKPRLAKHFLGKMFAMIADLTGIVIETTRYTLQTVIQIISGLLTTSVNLICNLANSLCRILTFNQVKA